MSEWHSADGRRPGVAHWVDPAGPELVLDGLAPGGGGGERRAGAYIGDGND